MEVQVLLFSGDVVLLRGDPHVQHLPPEAHHAGGLGDELAAQALRRTARVPPRSEACSQWWRALPRLFSLPWKYVTAWELSVQQQQLKEANQIEGGTSQPSVPFQGRLPDREPSPSRSCSPRAWMGLPNSIGCNVQST
mmetsp:Transcript_33990/g.96298  ORF Transcript_33990/g.96298 Transcript_33990/m.96298 type:complete len:138 (-) Transcript_33990:144-557(-)